MTHVLCRQPSAQLAMHEYVVHNGHQLLTLSTIMLSTPAVPFLCGL